MVRLLRLRYAVETREGILPRGSVVRESRFRPEVAATLEARRVVVPVATPPLGLVPGWTVRGRRLAQNGITSVEAALDLTPQELGALFGVGPGLAGRWQKQLEEHFVIPEPATRG